MKIDLTADGSVTGASRGASASHRTKLAETGAPVLCASRNLDQVERLARNLPEAEATPRRHARITHGDVRDRVKALIEQQPIDILVNNAGSPKTIFSIRMKPEAGRTCFGPISTRVSHHPGNRVKKMIRARWGRVITLLDRRTVRESGPGDYASSKRPLIGFTKSCWRWRSGPRSVTVERHRTGFVETAMTDAMTDEGARSRRPHRSAPPRQADDVALPAVFLASEQAGYITGTVMNVSGGLYT